MADKPTYSQPEQRVQKSLNLSDLAQTVRRLLDESHPPAEFGPS